MVQSSEGHRPRSQRQQQRKIPQVLPFGYGYPPARNHGAEKENYGQYGHHTVDRTHRLRNLMFVHLVEVPAFLFVEFVVDHSGSRGHEHNANDKIKSMHAIGVCNL